MGYRFKIDLNKACLSCSVKDSYKAGRNINHNKYSYRIRKKINGKFNYVRSTYEAFYIDFLNKNNISYIYEPHRFDLKKKGSYLPDFYLTDENLYVEIKGYLRKIDIEKIRLTKKIYKINILILSRNELKNLGFKEIEYRNKIKLKHNVKKCRIY